MACKAARHTRNQTCGQIVGVGGATAKGKAVLVRIGEEKGRVVPGKSEQLGNPKSYVDAPRWLEGGLRRKDKQKAWHGSRG